MTSEYRDGRFVYFNPRWLLKPNAKLNWVERLFKSASIRKLRMHYKVRQELS